MPLGHFGRRVADVDLPAGDAEAAAVEREELGQAGQRVLGGGVGDAVRPRGVRRDRAVVDDPPAARVLGLHHPHRVLGAQEGPGEVGVDHPLPVGQVDLVRLRRRAEHARVVHQQVEPPPAVRDRVEERGHRCGTVTSAGYRQRGAVRQAPDATLSRRAVLAPARRRDPPPGRQQGPGDAPAESRPRPGHHGHTGGCHFVSSPIIGYWRLTASVTRCYRPGWFPRTRWGMLFSDVSITLRWHA